MFNVATQTTDNNTEKLFPVTYKKKGVLAEDWQLQISVLSREEVL